MILLNEVVMGDRNDVGQGRLIIVAGPIRSGSTFLYVSYERSLSIQFVLANLSMISLNRSIEWFIIKMLIYSLALSKH